MATRKPKAAKAPAKASKATASSAAPKARAKKASAAKAKAKNTSELVALEVGTFVKFTGYVNETPEEDQVFSKNDTLYIVGVEEATDENPMMYTCISGSSVTLYEENPENENIVGQQLVAQEVQEVTGRALATAKENYAPIPSVDALDAIIEENGGNLLEAAEATYGQIEQSYFYLGGILARIKREGSHLVENGGKFEGDTAWDEYCQSEFDFSGAKGGDLARLYVTFAAIPDFDPSSLSDIGWSKVREIQRFVTEENYTDLIEDARSMTRDELKVQLTTQYVDDEGRTPSGAVAARPGGRNSIKTATVTFKMVEENATALELALAEAKKVYGVDTDSEALTRIIISWAEDHVSSASKQKRITSKIAQAEKQAGKSDKKPSGGRRASKKEAEKQAA